MKITLDFENKIATIGNSENLSEIVEQLKKSVDDWKEWKITQETIWMNPVPCYPTFPQFPTFPSAPIITYY